MYNRKIMENREHDEWLKNLPAQTEKLAFDSSEMIRCEKCERSNPPNRLKCVYCGAELNVSEAQIQNVQPNLRKLEAWEKGFNLIILPNEQKTGDINFAGVAKLLKIEPDVLRQIVELKKALPLARVESQTEAEITKRILAEYKIETRILSDEVLASEKPPNRLRGIEFFDEKLVLILFNRDEIVEIANDDLALIVAGAVSERKIQATEKHNKKGENKILDTTEIASDETLLDIYSRSDANGFRIWTKGFDFSGLETEKGILAKDNLKKLIDRLLHTAQNARFVDDYRKVREVLADVWEVEQKNESQGLKRESFGKFNLGSVTTVNNLSQFTKYSRLQWHLL
jgi:hypothetical protein